MSNFLRVIVATVLVAVQPLISASAPPDIDGDGKVGPQEAIDLAQSWKGPALPSGGPQPWQIDGATIFYNTGKVGVGSATPHHQLRISGGPIWTANGWIGSLELDNGAAIGWQANDAGKRFGIGHSGAGLHFFNTDSDPGTATSEAQYAMTINDAGTVHIPGSFGIGGDISDQGARFQVNDGRIRIRESATLERWDLFYDPPSQKFYLQENAAYNHLVFTKGPDERVGMGTVDPAAKLHVIRPVGTAVLGESANGNGVVGTSAAEGFGATAGTHSGTNGIGVFGLANLGSSAIGVWGSSESGLGAVGSSNINVGVKGISNSNIGVQGVSTSSSGVEGRSNSSEGVYGNSESGQGVRGYSASNSGVHGESPGNVGVTGIGQTGVVAKSSAANGTGLLAEGSFAASLVGYVQITGDLLVTGSINKLSSSNLMDHPLDPANKYLFHSSIESPDRMNVYNGNVVTDASGFVVVLLPEYFEALNIDYRYQLTVIGQFAQAIIAEKLQGNRFTIRTDKPNVEVSWQVTGVRQDAWAKAYPNIVEQEKSGKEKGKYLNPELFGQPEEMGIHYRPGTEVDAANYR